MWRSTYTYSYGDLTVPSETEQYTQYYPSGLPWKYNTGDNPGTQPYKYGGKEFVEMHGWDSYDYGARVMYPAVGPQFMSVDPLCEKYYWISPYAYCLNNPVRFVDPDGRQVILGGPALNEGMISILPYTDLNDVWVLGSAILSTFTDIQPQNIDGSPASGQDIEAAKNGLLLPVLSGSAVNKASNVIENAAKGKAGKIIIKENGVTEKSYGTNDAHKPAHAHVKGGGKEVRVGPNGKPLKGQPELSDKQRKVVENNKKVIRKEVNAVGKQNKKIEDQKQRND
ncbi:hypothetical protein SDC9_86550 [bioreactor metagenome]|uniref:RHS repeat-associated core domain-containing protein n=1 Tax=bioreactor metagenome TaxID=1076179 RepID=A0A644ZQP2_9ZZZZ